MYIVTPDHQITQLHGNSEIDYELKVQDNTSFYKNFQERMVLKTNFAGFLPERKDEIMTMFDSASGLNKFQKMLIKDKLMNL